MPIYVLEPPLRYNHAFAGPVIERVLPLQEARGGPVKDLGGYRRHERAHCNGWSEGHEN